ncbi:Calcineurin-like phosphoesterase [Lachnospiraceae bacterium XBB1006]|nr:Calcineurin-like phosphoesterase [Lachnospiraceae bacterium XBB1006]
MKRELRRKRIQIYCVGLAWTALLPALLLTVNNIVMQRLEGIVTGGVAVLLFVTGYVILRRFRRGERMGYAMEYELDEYEYLEKCSDRYAKRLINSVVLLISAVALFGAMVAGLWEMGNAKLEEAVEIGFASMWMIEIPMFLVIKNSLGRQMIRKRLDAAGDERYRWHVMSLALGCAAYWGSVIALMRFFLEKITYPVNILAGATMIMVLGMLLYNLTLRSRVVVHRITFNPIRVLVFAVAVGGAVGYHMLQVDTWYTQPYINSVARVEHAEHNIVYDEASGVYTITKSTDTLKILHLTDIHLGGSLFSASKDVKALKACYAEICATHPDLVVVTGDMTFPLGIMSMSFNNEAPVQQFAAFMRNVGIPWCFTYGNHDTEGVASMSAKGLDELYKSLSYKTSGTLLYPYVQPDITGRNNQLIEVRNMDGSLNQALFLIDSNAYTENGINDYDYIRDDQVEWYKAQVRRLEEQSGGPVKSLAFFHIPLQQYRTAYELYEAGSSEVTYFFGSNDEKMINKVCCSEHPSKLFEAMKELGSTTGTFCGHDHYNNMSLEYQGIRLTYGMSIDYLAMPGIAHDTKQRGGELITVYSDGTWGVEQIPLTSIKN